MNSATAQRLIAINREFYDRFGPSFSATRRRVQPGVRRILGMLLGNEAILDLGCGNGELARELSRRQHLGRYLGIDFSQPMLREAELAALSVSARFLVADLTTLAEAGGRTADRYSSALRTSSFDIVFAFAALHHIPGFELQTRLIGLVHELLKSGGRFIHSNWQFLNSRKLSARIQPWATVGMDDSQMDAGDHLLDWRGGSTGFRYVHQFSEGELSRLAAEGGFQVQDSFYSDGDGGRLGLYQVWLKA